MNCLWGEAWVRIYMFKKFHTLCNCNGFLVFNIYSFPGIHVRNICVCVCVCMCVSERAKRNKIARWIEKCKNEQLIYHHLSTYHYVFILFFFNFPSSLISTRVPHPEPSSLLPPHTIPLGRPSAPATSIQYCAWNLDWRLVSYMILYIFQCHSPKSSHPLPLPKSP